MIKYKYDQYKKDVDWIGYSVRVYEDEVSTPGLKWSPITIVAIARGGLVPGVYLSHYLNRSLETIKWQLRDGNDQPSLSDQFISQTIGKELLIVDDINDSGETFSQLLTCFKNEPYWYSDIEIKKNIKTACLIEKSSSSFKVDICPNKTDKEDWIVFTWENEPHI